MLGLGVELKSIMTHQQKKRASDMIKQKRKRKKRVANVADLKVLSEVMSAYLSKKKRGDECSGACPSTDRSSSERLVCCRCHISGTGTRHVCYACDLWPTLHAVDPSAIAAEKLGANKGAGLNWLIEDMALCHRCGTVESNLSVNKELNRYELVSARGRDLPLF